MLDARRSQNQVHSSSSITVIWLSSISVIWLWPGTKGESSPEQIDSAVHDMSDCMWRTLPPPGSITCEPLRGNMAGKFWGGSTSAKAGRAIVDPGRLVGNLGSTMLLPLVLIGNGDGVSSGRPSATFAASELSSSKYVGTVTGAGKCCTSWSGWELLDASSSLACADGEKDLQSEWASPAFVDRPRQCANEGRIARKPAKLVDYP